MLPYNQRKRFFRFCKEPGCRKEFHPEGPSCFYCKECKKERERIRVERMRATYKKRKEIRIMNNNPGNNSGISQT